jgi:hypothetical protein
MIEIFFLKECNPISEVLIPSIKMSPSTFVILNSAEIIELLPPPVLPQIPTFSPGLISKEMSRKTFFPS